MHTRGRGVRFLLLGMLNFCEKTFCKVFNGLDAGHDLAPCIGCVAFREACMVLDC